MASYKRYADPWLHCRLDPFTSAGGTKKPDNRGSARSIVVEHILADEIRCVTANGFTIQTLPGMLPFSAIITGNTPAAIDVNINGFNYTSTSSINHSWYPIGVPTEWTNVAALRGWSPTATPLNDPYASTRARVLAVKRRLMYTGSLSTNSGIINVAPSSYRTGSMSAQTTSATNPAAANTISIQNLDRALALGIVTPLNFKFKSVDMSLSTLPVVKRDTVAYRVEMGAEIVSKQLGDIHEFCDTPDTGFALVCNAALNPALAGTTLNPLVVDPDTAANAAGAGVWVDDQTWVGEIINVSGIAAGATFRFETAMCVEYEIPSTGAFAPLATKAPKPRPAVVQQAQAIVNAMPVALPGIPKNFMM